MLLRIKETDEFIVGFLVEHLLLSDKILCLQCFGG